MIYSCAPRYVQQMIKAADVFSVPIKVKDVVNGYPSAANLVVSNCEIILVMLKIVVKINTYIPPHPMGSRGE